jgi:hypothetical protein
MKSSLLFLTITFLLIKTKADPQPTGGASCHNDQDCGGFDVGQCVENNNSNVSVCVCSSSRGNPDCSYQRISRDAAGGLQFLAFLCIAGVGNFMLGYTGRGIGQLLLVLSGYLSSCISCCIYFGTCGSKKGFFCGVIISIIFGVLISLAVLIGLGWSIYDGVEILMGNVNDSNGYQTY